MILGKFPAPGGVDPTKPPKYTYTGQSELVTEEEGWKIRFLTSGTFTLLSPAKLDIDAFLVGGGASGWVGGGGGGYTTNGDVTLNRNTGYKITIPSGGIAGNDSGANGGICYAFGLSAEGGKTPSNHRGGAGGSGGGGETLIKNTTAGSGGSDGGDGGNGISFNSTPLPGGKGQGTTTREFGEPSGELYSGGGGGLGFSAHSYGGAGGAGGGGAGGDDGGGAGGEDATFYGGGGGGGNETGALPTSGSGYQGICIIRNHREAKTA
ncbi:hypothetical protein [Anaerotruncus massiliensis (ex Liu et al. 2021)]|uniref:glycine-rich domain-containing protein n=1 Tax=Anaerotruncus massiliensis (ex Liu et al. 2021) TaxID=2321404 RepID=UPI003AF5A71F